MYSLRKFAGRTGDIGKPLPEVFPSLAINGIAFRYGAVSMIAGAPGSFKSITALNIAASWARQGLGILFFSFDSDEFTVAKRVGAILTGAPAGQVEDDFVNGRMQRYQAAMREIDSASFVYRNLDMDGMTSHVHAYEAVHGGFPDIIFVDNLINTVDDPTDWGGMITILRDLDILARETRSHIFVCHHASESWAIEHPGMAPPSWAIQGKVSQIPRLVLTVAAEGLALNMACTKNTNGPQDPQARNYMHFMVHPSLRVEDFQWRNP